MGLSVLKPGQSWANWDTLKLITNLEHSLSELKFNLQHSLREAIYSIVFTNTQCALDMPEFRSGSTTHYLYDLLSVNLSDV